MVPWRPAMTPIPQNTSKRPKSPMLFPSCHSPYSFTSTFFLPSLLHLSVIHVLLFSFPFSKLPNLLLLPLRLHLLLLLLLLFIPMRASSTSDSPAFVFIRLTATTTY